MYYFKHHIGDFNRATRHLTRVERSIYRDILDLYYETEQPITLDISLLCRKICARSEEEKSAVIAILDEFFDETSIGWYQSRCEEEIEKYKSSSTNKSIAGKASAAAKAAKKEAAINAANAQHPFNVRSTDVEQVFNERSTDAQQRLNSESTNHKPITNNQEPRAKVKTIVPPDGETADGKAQVVFDYWREKRGHPRANMDTKRQKAIKSRLKDGYSAEDLCKAVDGIALSRHHMGQNDQQTVYDDIELICRNGPNVDKFIKLIDDSQSGPALSPRLQQQYDKMKAWAERGD